MFRSKKKVIEEFQKKSSTIKSETFHFKNISRYFVKRDQSKCYQSISDKTYQDLDLDELFMFIDRTASKVGQQFLYNALRTIPTDNSRAKRLEYLISFFNDHRAIRDSTLLDLSKLNKTEAYYITSLFQDEYIAKPSWFNIVYGLSFTSIALVGLSFLFPKLILLLIIILIINYCIHYWNKKNLYQYGASIPQLLALNGVAKQIIEHTGINKDKADLQNSIKSVDYVSRRMILFKLEARLQSDVALIVENFTEIVKAMFLIEPILLFHVLKKLDLKREYIHTVYKFVAEIDVALSIASLRENVKYYCLPNVLDSKELTGEEIYHPLIENPVTNSITLTDKSVLITGSNMSGKTTFIRAIGINAISALTINTCFAKRFSLPRLKIHSAIRITDNLMNNRSYYLEEVLTIKEMITSGAGSAIHLFLLDEIYKGTNTIERIAAGKAVLSHLSQQNNIVFVSTHDIELAELLTEEYDLYHFSEQVNERSIDFDFKLKRGKLTTRNAINILAANDYPSTLIDEAKNISEKLERGRA